MTPLLKTLTTKDRSPLRGLKRNSCLLAALRAGGFGFDLGGTMAGSGPEHRDPLRLARLTALRFVLELLIVKEKLFTGGKNKIRPAIHTLQYLVLEFHRENAPFSPIPAAFTCGGEVPRE